MRSSDRLNETLGMVNIIFSRAVTIIFGSIWVRIVIKDLDRNGCSRATLRGYRTDLCMMPSGGSDKSSRMVPTVLTRVTTWLKMSRPRSSDRSTGRIWQESHGPSGTPHYFVHETSGSIGRNNENGYDCSLTDGYLDLTGSRSFGNRDGTYPSG
jgi:hypothetical protein